MISNDSIYNNQIIEMIAEAKKAFFFKDNKKIKPFYKNIYLFEKEINSNTYKIFGLKKDQQNLVDYDELRKLLLKELGCQDDKVMEVIGDSSKFDQKGSFFAKEHFAKEMRSFNGILIYGYTGKKDPQSGQVDTNGLVNDYIDENPEFAKRVLANIVDYHTRISLGQKNQIVPTLAERTGWGDMGSKHIKNFFLVWDEGVREGQVFLTDQGGAKFGDDTIVSDNLVNSKILMYGGGIQSFQQANNILERGYDIVSIIGLREQGKQINIFRVDEKIHKVNFFDAALFFKKLKDLENDLGGLDLDEDIIIAFKDSYLSEENNFPTSEKIILFFDPFKSEVNTRKKELWNRAWSFFLANKVYRKVNKIVSIDSNNESERIIIEVHNKFYDLLKKGRSEITIDLCENEIQDIVNIIKRGLTLIGELETTQVPFDGIVKLIEELIANMDDGAEEFRVSNFGNNVSKIFRELMQNVESMLPIIIRPNFLCNVSEFAKRWVKASLSREAALRYGLSYRGCDPFTDSEIISIVRNDRLLDLAKRLIDCMNIDPAIIQIKNHLKRSDIVVFLAYGGLGDRQDLSGRQKPYIEGYGWVDFIFCDIVRYVLVSAGIPCYSDLLLQDYFGNEILPKWFIPLPKLTSEIFTEWCTKAASLASHMVMFGSPIYGGKTRNDNAVCRKELKAFEQKKGFTEDTVSLVLISTRELNEKKEVIDCSLDPNFLKSCFPEEIEHLVKPPYVVDYRGTNSNVSAYDLYTQKFKTVVQFAFCLIEKLTRNCEFSYYKNNNWRELFKELISLPLINSPRSNPPRLRV